MDKARYAKPQLENFAIFLYAASVRPLAVFSWLEENFGITEIKWGISLIIKHDTSVGAIQRSHCPRVPLLICEKNLDTLIDLGTIRREFNTFEFTAPHTGSGPNENVRCERATTLHWQAR
jgi:hypothetical protein